MFAPMERFQQVQRAIAAAVIDIDHFPQAKHIHHRRQATMELWQDERFVEHRDHDGVDRSAAHGQDVQHVGNQSLLSRCYRYTRDTLISGEREKAEWIRAVACSWPSLLPRHWC